MARRGLGKSPASISDTKPPLPSGLLQMAIRPSSTQTAGSADMARRAMLKDLVGSIVVGPSMFPIKRSTGEAFFTLAIERLADHDKTMAEALCRYMGQHARLEALDFRTSTSSLDPATRVAATVEWLLDEEPVHPIKELRKDFERFRRVVGKQTCHPRTIRRQYDLLRAYGSAHNYPIKSSANLAVRSAWIQTHLPMMIAEAQVVSCWHPLHNLTKQDLEEIREVLNAKTSISKLSTLVLARLHSTTSDSIRKRLRPRKIR